MPENPIYDFMKANRLTDKDEATFLMEYSNSAKAKELFSFFQANKLTDKDFNTFYGTYLKKKVSIADVGMAAKGGGEVGVSKAPSEEIAQETPEQKLSKLGLNVTFQPKQKPQYSGTEPVTDYLNKLAKEPDYIDLSNSYDVGRLSGMIDAKSKTDKPVKASLFVSDEMIKKAYPQYAKISGEKDKTVSELKSAVSDVAAQNAFDKIASKKDLSQVTREDLLEAGLEYTKQVAPSQWNRNVEILEGGKDLGDENKYNLEKAGAAVLLNKAQGVVQDENTLQRIAQLDKETDAVHPKFAVAKAWDIISAYNHKKDNKANGGWWRTRPSLLLVENWLEEPELKEMFVGNEVGYNILKKQLQELPNEKKVFDAEDVSISGGLNRFTQSIAGGLENIGNIFDSDAKRQQSNLNPTLGRGTLTGNYQIPGESNPLLQRIQQLKDKEKQEKLTQEEWKELDALNKSTKVRSGWDKFKDDTFDTLGQVVLQAALTKGVGAGGKIITSAKAPMLLKTGISTALISYDQSRKSAVYHFPNDDAKQNIYTGAMTAANILSERIFKDEKVFNAFKKGLGAELTTTLKNLSAENISRQQVKNIIVNNAVKYGFRVGVDANKNAFEEMVVQAADEGLKTTMSAEDYDETKALKNIADVYVTTLYSMGAVSALSAIKSNTRADEFNSVALYRGALDPQKTQQDIERLYETGEITKQEKDEKLNILSKAASIIESEPSKIAAKPVKDKAQYLINTLNTELKKEQLEKVRDKNQEEELSKEINESENKAAEIYNALTPEQEIIQQAIDNNEVEGMFLDMAKAALSDPQQAKQLLDEAKSQATGQVAGELGSARSGVEKAWGKTIADFVAPQEASTGLSRGDVANKAVDKSGEPIEMYHGSGTSEDFEEFNNNSFFTPNDYIAENYAENQGGKVYKRYIYTKNPLEISEDKSRMSRSNSGMLMAGTDSNIIDLLSKLYGKGVVDLYKQYGLTKGLGNIVLGDFEPLIKYAKENGHDSIKFKDVSFDHLVTDDTYVVFDPKNVSKDKNVIKSKSETQDQSLSSNTPKEQPKAETPTQETTPVSEPTTPVSTSGIKKSNRGVVKKARGIEDLTEPRDIVMQYFAGGNKINPSAIKELFGGKDERLHFGKGTGGEQKSKISLLKGDAPSIKELAHKLWEASGGLEDDYRYTDRDFRDAIESVLQDHNSPTSMSIELVDKYINKAVKQELTDQEAKDISDGLIRDITKYVEELPENQQNELVKLLSKYQDKFGFIDWDAVEKDSNGFDPDILSLTIETQEALDGIIQKNLKSGQGEFSDASRQSSRQEKGEEKVIPQKKPEEPTTPPTTQAKELADKVRKLKIDLGKLSGGGLQSNPLGLPVAVWNGAMDIIAKTIETGGNIADAIKRGLNYIQKNHRGQWNKKQFNDEVMKELGVRGITVNGEDLVVKDVDKEFAETINGFYSDLEQTILEVSPTDKGTPQAWLKKIGTGDEAKWTGVTDWLNSLPKDQKVTRKEILDWLKENRIQVVEVVKGSEKQITKASDLPKSFKADGFVIRQETDGWVRQREDGGMAEYIVPERALKYYNDEQGYNEGNATKFSQYQLEGEKENYKEVLVTMPNNSKYQNELNRLSKKYNAEPNYKSLRESEATDSELEFLRGLNTENFKSSHFDEPNILVHLRMNTRTDAEGKKVLFLEEVQSDWGQKGKKEGFANSDKEKRLNELLSKRPETSTREELEIYNLEKESFGEIKTPTAPFVTDTNAWVKLGLKVALKEAVKQGADKIAWTTGEQQNERYDLSKQVNWIQKVIDKTNEDRSYIDISTPTTISTLIVDNRIDKGKILEVRNSAMGDVIGKNLSDVVGKDVAERLLNGEDGLKLEGEGLKVGGKGMKGFYGSPTEGSLGIVGNVAKSLFKQEPKTVKVKLSDNLNAPFDITVKDENGKITTHNFDSKSKASAWLSKEVSNGKKYQVISEKSQEEITTTQHSITITPELKQEAETGLPLFKDIKGRGREIADLLRKGKIKMGGLQSNIAGIPIAIYNAAIETIALALEGGATLTQAIQKAINKHKLNQQKGFNQKEFISKLEDATGEKFTDDQQEPPKPPKEEPSDVGIKHSVTEGIRAAYGLPEYERDNKTDKELEKEADELIAEGFNVESVISKMERGEPPTGVENFILTKYVADLDAKLSKSPDNETIAKLHRVLKATDKIGSLQSEAFRTRRYIRPSEETLGTFLMAEMEDSGVDELTDEQKSKVIKEFEELKRANDALNQKIAELREQLLNKEAEENISSERKRAKRGRKTDKEFAEERKNIVEDIREKLKKARQDTQSTIIPYAKELIAIAPDVAKLVKNLVDNGIVKLEDVVSNIHEILKDEIQGITPKDVRDIIAGEYNEKKPTRNELAEKVKDLKDEAILLGKLETLENSEIPKDEKKKIERNRRIKELRDKVKEHPNTKLSDAKSRIRSQISKIEEQIRKGDFSVPKKKEVPLDKEGKELQAKLINLRRDREIRRLKLQYDKRTKWQKGMDKAAEVFNVPRSIMASTDFSAPLNQAIIATISNPLLSLRAAKQMFSSAFSQKQFDQWFYEVKETPRYELMKELKLGISDPHSPYLTAREEAFMSGYAEQIPFLGRLIKGSERAYVQYLNKMRVDLFNKFVDRLEENGKTYRNSKELYEKAAKYINNITGRGDLGKLEQFAPLFNGLLFSPRLMASRLNLINPVYFGTLPKELKKQYIKDMGSFLGLGSVILSLFSIYSKTQDDDDDDKIKVETDVRSSDFAKIKQGDTRWNIWGGFQPYVRLIGQIASGERKSSNTGLVQELDGNAAFGTSRGDVVASFFRGKLAPVPSAIVDLTSGRNAAGEEVTIKDAILTRVFPLSSQGVAEGWEQYGALSLLNIGIPSIFGVGTQTYEKKEKEIKPTIKRSDGEVKLTDEQFDEFEKKARSNIETKLEKLKKLQEYKDLQPEEKISLERVVSNMAVTGAEEYVINKYGLLFSKDVKKEETEATKKQILDKLNADNGGW